ncbi:MAG: ChbG/HpnK family deacetylase [Elusimicrobia bacterium]|nr:ChbG/HpnK family deacetylase [Elusimicrobiota bacterium]
MHALIVNADDFGISLGVSRGILETHLKGIVTHTSLMPNMPAFSPAVELLKNAPKLEVGVHGTLTCGSPVSPPHQIPSLTESNGQFHSLTAFLLRYWAGLIRKNEIEQEIEAQILRFKEHALTPNHLNSHHHIHFLPNIAPIFFKLAQRHHIQGVRWGHPTLSSKRPFLGRGLCGLQIPRNLLRNYFIKKGIKTTPLPKGFQSPDCLLGLEHYSPGTYLNKLRTWLSIPWKGTAELVCHPGYVDSELTSFDLWTTPRDEERQALIHPSIFSRIQ